MFKICLIGCGDHSRYVHGPSLKRYVNERDNTVLSACCDLNKSRAEEYHKDFGFINFYTDWQKMLDIEKPAAVCLIVPEKYTEEIASSVMSQGYPLILEKPPGRDYQEASRLYRVAVKNGVPNRVAFNRRYMPLMRELNSRLDTFRQDNPIKNVQYDMFRYNRLEKDFYLTAIHAIDTVRFIADSDYSEVCFTYQPIGNEEDEPVNIYMSCIMESGCVAQINISPASGAVIERATVNAKDNTFLLYLPMGYQSGRLLHISKKDVVFDSERSDIGDGSEMFEDGGFYYENASFFNSLMTNETIYGDIGSALQSVEVAECISRKQKYYKKGGY